MENPADSEGFEPIEKAAERLLRRLKRTAEILASERQKSPNEFDTGGVYAPSVRETFEAEERPPASNADSILSGFTVQATIRKTPATRVGLVMRYGKPYRVVRMHSEANDDMWFDW